MMCSVVLATIAGAVPPAEVAEVVAVDAISLADAGMLFPADPAEGVAVVTPRALPTRPPWPPPGLAVAGILFPADPVGTLSPSEPAVGTLSRLTLLGYCSWPTLLGCCPHLR